jgi:hypothetical protein
VRSTSEAEKSTRLPLSKCSLYHHGTFTVGDDSARAAVRFGVLVRRLADSPKEAVMAVSGIVTANGAVLKALAQEVPNAGANR